MVDGNYGRIQQIMWSRADTVVVLDLPRWRVIRQLLVRTLRLGWTGVELWNGNRETLRNLLRRDPQHNILLWSWTNHAKNRRRYRMAAADSRWSCLTFPMTRSRQQAHKMIETASASG